MKQAVQKLALKKLSAELSKTRSSAEAKLAVALAQLKQSQHEKAV
jgi:hypothetical protein